jgi:hypothetical protein
VEAKRRGPRKVKPLGWISKPVLELDGLWTALSMEGHYRGWNRKQRFRNEKVQGGFRLQESSPILGQILGRGKEFCNGIYPEK